METNTSNTKSTALVVQPEVVPRPNLHDMSRQEIVQAIPQAMAALTMARMGLEIDGTEDLAAQTEVYFKELRLDALLDAMHSVFDPDKA